MHSSSTVAWTTFSNPTRGTVAVAQLVEQWIVIPPGEISCEFKSHPSPSICPYGGNGRHGCLRNSCESVRVRVSLWVLIMQFIVCKIYIVINLLSAGMQKAEASGL